mmetsp:Transcript_18256/g.24699  ORF Transcript_18256/g.24699 Transcript_18256/m.24699 type:complete len:91 (+) Transcript_18256:2122-2394(+)
MIPPFKVVIHNTGIDMKVTNDGQGESGTFRNIAGTIVFAKFLFIVKTFFKRIYGRNEQFGICTSVNSLFQKTWKSQSMCNRYDHEKDCSR